MRFMVRQFWCRLWLETARQHDLNPWWRHQMGTFSVLLAICAGYSPVTGEFPAQRPVAPSCVVFFDLSLNIRLSNHWWGWSIETLSRPLWRHCNTVLTEISVARWLHYTSRGWYSPRNVTLCSYLPSAPHHIPRGNTAWWSRNPPENEVSPDNSKAMHFQRSNAYNYLAAYKRTDGIFLSEIGCVIFNW